MMRGDIVWLFEGGTRLGRVAQVLKGIVHDRDGETHWV
jgi:hypothetical protein